MVFNRLKGVETSCLVAAICFVLTYVLSIGYLVAVFDRSHLRDSITRQGIYDLDPDLIQDEWALRRDVIGVSVTITFVNAAAWIALSIALIQLAWLMSQSGQRMPTAHLTMAVLALAGTFFEILAFLLVIGSQTIGQLVAIRFNLDNWTGTDDEIGWRTLELAYTLVRGIVVWVDAFEWCILASIMGIIYISHKKLESSIFTQRFVRLGAVLGLLCFFHFVFDLLRIFAWNMFGGFGGFISIATRLFVIPVWLVMLGKQMNTGVKPPALGNGRAQQDETEGTSTPDFGGDDAEVGLS